MGLALSVIFASGIGVGVLAYGSWKYKIGWEGGPLNTLGAWIAGMLYPFEVRMSDWGEDTEGWEADPGSRPPSILCGYDVRLPGAIGNSGFYSAAGSGYAEKGKFKWDESHHRYKYVEGSKQVFAKGDLTAHFSGNTTGKPRTPITGLGPVAWKRTMNPEDYVSARLNRGFAGQPKYPRDRADLDGYHYFQSPDGFEVPWLPPAKNGERAIKPTANGMVGSDGRFYAPSDERQLQEDIKNMRRDGVWHWGNVRQFPKKYITDLPGGPGKTLNWYEKTSVPDGFKAYDFANYGTEAEYATLEWLPSNGKSGGFRAVNEGNAQRWRPDWTQEDYRTYIAAMLNWSAIHWKNLKSGVAKQKALHKASRKELF